MFGLTPLCVWVLNSCVDGSGFDSWKRIFILEGIIFFILIDNTLYTGFSYLIGSS